MNWSELPKESPAIVPMNLMLSFKESGHKQKLDWMSEAFDSSWGSNSGTFSWGAKIGAPNRMNGGKNKGICVDWRFVSIHVKVLLLSRVDCRVCRPAPEVQS